VTGIQPELWVDRPASAVAFYQAAFGAQILMRVGDGEDIVAQLAVDDAVFWVGGSDPGLRRLDPRAAGGATGRTLLVVADPDAFVTRAVDAGRARVAPRPDRRSARPRVGDRPAGRRLRVIASRVADGGCQDGGMTPATMMRPLPGPSGVR
jgi:PhnB protein